MIEQPAPTPVADDISINKPMTVSQNEQTTWDLSTIFPSVEAWKDEASKLSADLKQFKQFQGQLGTSAETLLDVIERWGELSARADRLKEFANLSFYSNTRDSSAQALSSQAGLVTAETSETFAFIDPEIIAIGAETITGFIEELPALQQYSFLLSEITRRSTYVRSPEVEALLAALSPLKTFPENTHTALNNSDLRFEPVKSGAAEIVLNHGSIEKLLESPDRDTRAAAFDNYSRPYETFANTFSATLTQQAQTSLLFARASGYKSTLERDLFKEQLPTEVFTSILHACEENRGVMQRYFKIKAKLLGLEQLRESDIRAPLGKNPPEIRYARARDIVIEGVAPLGEEYQRIARNGLYNEHWVDAFSREGKYSNAFSSGSYLTEPRILLNYNDSALGLGILAHELGHSMHSHFSTRTQPYFHSGYSMLVAETASNLNQVLVRDGLLKSSDPEMRLAALGEAFYVIHRYLFLFPTLSKVEHFVHDSAAKQESVSVDQLRSFSSESFNMAYGDSVSSNPEQTGVRWAQYSHLFEPYYLYKYGVGISVGMAVGQQILNGDTALRDEYLELLKTGSSRPTTDIFRMVGIDITSPEPYRQAFSLVSQYVDQLEEIANLSANL